MHFRASQNNNPMMTSACARSRQNPGSSDRSGANRGLVEHQKHISSRRASIGSSTSTVTTKHGNQPCMISSNNITPSASVTPFPSPPSDEPREPPSPRANARDNTSVSDETQS